jgi:hypothetical protein
MKGLEHLKSNCSYYKHSALQVSDVMLSLPETYPETYNGHFFHPKAVSLCG